MINQQLTLLMLKSIDNIGFYVNIFFTKLDNLFSYIYLYLSSKIIIETSLKEDLFMSAYGIIFAIVIAITFDAYRQDGLLRKVLIKLTNINKNILYGISFFLFIT